MKNKVLSYLKNSDNYISGESISKNLNISRNAVWKHISSLRSSGYIIDSVRNKGYKLISSPDILDTTTITPYLETDFIGKTIYSFNEISSTNTYAKKLCKKEVINGAVVISETQNSGHGRFNRVWISPKGGIWNSIILSPNLEPIHAHKITLIAVVSMYLTLKKFNINTQIKWPNDLYLNNKKICGILSTMNCDMDKINYLIIGLGLNVNIDKSYFEENNLTTGTSLKIEFNKTFNRSEIIGTFYNIFEKYYKNFEKTYDLKEVVSICKDNSIIKNKKGFLVSLNYREEITCIDINDNGELIIKDSKGVIRPVLSGEVTFKNL